jgi:hypothetical protein
MQPVLPPDSADAASPASVLAARFDQVRAYLSAPRFPLDAAAAEDLARRTAAALPAPAGPTLDPRQPRFGARGDGRADDTAALAAALAALEAAGGGTLLLAPGTEFLVGRPLRVPSNTRIAGRGLLRMPRPFEGGLLTAAGATGIVLDGIGIQGTGRTHGADFTERLCWFTDCSGLFFSHVQASQSTILFHVQRCRNAVLVGCDMHDMITRSDLSQGYGWLADDRNDGYVVYGNRIHQSQRHAVYVSWGSRNAIVARNDVRDCWSVGITIYAKTFQQPVENVALVRNSIAHVAMQRRSVSPWGIGATGNIHRMLVAANTVEDTESGIYLQGDYSYPLEHNPREIYVLNNSVHDSTDRDGAGIHVSNATDVTIAGNEVLNPAGTGIMGAVDAAGPGSYLRRVSIRGNTVSGARGTAVNVSGGARVADVRLGANRIVGARRTFLVTDDTRRAVRYDVPAVTPAWSARAGGTASDGAPMQPEGSVVTVARAGSVVSIALSADRAPDRGAVGVRVRVQPGGAMSRPLMLPQGATSARMDLEPGELPVPAGGRLEAVAVASLLFAAAPPLRLHAAATVALDLA